MYERTIWIADEIGCMFMDDWLNLPFKRTFRNVYEGLSEPSQRHADCWFLTH